MATLPFHLIWHILSIGGCSSELVFYHALYRKLKHKRAKDEAIAKDLPEPKRPSWYVDNGYLVGSCLMARPKSLIQAARHVNATRWLIKKASVNIEDKDECGHTALMLAGSKGHFEVVKVLLDAGAEMEGKNRRGETTLMLAAEYGHSEVVKVLLDAGADKDALCHDDHTALMLAALNANSDAFKFLLDAGADERGICALVLAKSMTWMNEI